MLLFLVVGEDLPVGVGEGQGILAMIRRSVAKAFGILID